MLAPNVSTEGSGLNTSAMVNCMLLHWVWMAFSTAVVSDCTPTHSTWHHSLTDFNPERPRPCCLSPTTPIPSIAVVPCMKIMTHFPYLLLFSFLIFSWFTSYETRVMKMYRCGREDRQPTADVCAAYVGWVMTNLKDRSLWPWLSITCEPVDPEQGPGTARWCPSASGRAPPPSEPARPHGRKSWTGRCGTSWSPAPSW